MPLSSNLRVGLSVKQTTPGDWGSTDANLAKTFAITLANGVGAGQANLIFADTRTLAASANEDLDLAGVLTDTVGATLTFTRVKAIIVAAAAANTNNVIVGGAASNGFVSWAGGATHTITVRPGGVFCLSCGAADLNGYAVTAGTADQLRIANSGAGTSVVYDIAILGTS